MSRQVTTLPCCYSRSFKTLDELTPRHGPTDCGL